MSSQAERTAPSAEDRLLLRTYAKFPFAIVRGEGNYVFDETGKRYLDLYGGHAVSCLGHSHPRWVEAMSRQLGLLDFYSNVCYLPIRAEAAERVLRHSYPSMVGAYFANSGAEANETALKIARKATGRPFVIAFHGGFHGRTLGALSVTGQPKMLAAFPENLASYTRFVEFGDAEALRRVPGHDAAAIILEPIQSLAGVRVAPAEYYRFLRDYATQHGIVLIFDEVQTGSGRTGAWFAGHHWGVEPDIVTTAKAVGGGFPVGMVLANERIANTVETGDQGTTFGGGPLAVRAVATTYRILEEEGLVERVARVSAVVIERLKELQRRGCIRDVRGLGYLLGVECGLKAKEVQRRLLEAGIIVGTSYQENTIRLLPPYTIEEAEWDLFFEKLEAICR